MTLTLYKNFSKRENSTKRPDSAGTDFEIVLKQPTSIQNPTFVIAGVDTDYNYAYWNGRYYFINDISIDTTGIMTIRCSDDVLASWKDEINALSAMVLYDTTGNSDIQDQRLGVVTSWEQRVSSANFRDDFFGGSQGSYVASVNGVEEVGTYVIPAGNLKYLLPNIETAWEDFVTGSDFADSLKSCFLQLVASGSVPDNIRDVRYIPFWLPRENAVNPLMVGRWESGTLGYRISDQNILKTCDVAIPWVYNDWRNSAPYTELYLYIPFIGTVSFPSANLINQQSLHIESSLSPTTGELAVTVSLGSGSPPIATYGANTGHSVALGSSNVAMNSIMNGATSIIGGVATGNPIGVMAGTLKALQPYNQSVGGIASSAGADLVQQVKCFVVSHNTSCPPSSVSSVMGTPTFAVKTLGNLSGYIQCQNASIDAPCTDSERTAINGYLNGGFFNE